MVNKLILSHIEFAQSHDLFKATSYDELSGLICKHKLMLFEMWLEFTFELIDGWAMCI